jgi:hypothetical protein
MAIDGDCGGLRNVLSDIGLGTGGSDAPGLKEKSGRAGNGDLDSFSIGVPNTRSVDSSVDLVRLPVAREKEAGAEDGDALAGKTK